MKKLLFVAAAGLLSAQPATAAVTIADYNVYADGSVYISGGSYGDIASGSFTNANGAGGTNFTSNTASSAALTDFAAALSAQYAGLDATGSGTTQWGAMTLTGTSDGINVFNIDGADWSSIYALTFSGTGTGAIVNVSGASLTNYVNIDFAGLSANNVLFNFYEASTVSMGGMNILGTILAPDAYVNLQGGSVAGSVISDSFHSEGTTIGGDAFTGLTGAVPEPATWAMMILGFGVIGAAMRRRGGVRRTLAA